MEQQAIADPLIGYALNGSYEIERLIGQGGMGRVYVAKHVRLPRRAAVKVLQPEYAEDESAYERFKREAEVASGLGSRHIVHVFDFGFVGKSPFMVMEYLEGRDLASYLAEKQQLEAADVVRLMDQAVSGIAAAHERRVIHRDIKPANLFLAREPDGGEVVKVLDFGLSKERGLSASLSGSNAVGTPAYMSPEQLRASRELDHRTDIYALAVTIFELLTGQLPFNDPQLVTMCQQIMNDPAPSVLTLRPDLSPTLDAVLMRALAKDPDARHSDVREFWREARAALERPGDPRAVRPAPPPPVIPIEVEAPQPARELHESTRPIRPHNRGDSPAPASAEADTHISAPRPVAIAQPRPAPAVGAAKPRGVPLLAIAAGVALLLGLAGFLLRPHRSSPLPETATAPTEARPAPEAVPAAHVSPPSAPVVVARPSPTEPAIEANPAPVPTPSAPRAKLPRKHAAKPAADADPLLGADKL